MVKKPTYEELEQRVKELEKEAIKHTQTEKDWDIFFESSNDCSVLSGSIENSSKSTPAGIKPLDGPEKN